MDAKTTREQKIRDIKCNLILDAARKVFSEKGFHNARLEDIAVEAGFSKASLYNYFTDKEQIFLNLATRDFELLLHQLERGAETSENLKSLLEFTFKTVIAFFGEHFVFFSEAFSFHHEIANSPLLQEHHAELLKNFINNHNAIMAIVANGIERARERQEINLSMDSLTAAQFIGALLRGTFFECKLNNFCEDKEKILENLIDFTCYGLGLKK